MSIRTAIYSRLAEDSLLQTMLSEKPKEIGEGPAIYEQWAAADTETPYLNLTFSFSPGGLGNVKRLGALDVDIFTSGYDTTITEAIQRRIIEVLDLWTIHDPEDGPIRIYLDTENDIPEDTEAMTHWNITFTLHYWRRAFIDSLQNR